MGIGGTGSVLSEGDARLLVVDVVCVCVRTQSGHVLVTKVVQKWVQNIAFVCNAQAGNAPISTPTPQKCCGCSVRAWVAIGSRESRHQKEDACKDINRDKDLRKALTVDVAQVPHSQVAEELRLVVPELSHDALSGLLLGGHDGRGFGLKEGSLGHLG